MTGKTGRLMRNTFHQITVTHYGICEMIHNFVVIFVELISQVCLSHGHTYPGSKTLPKRTSGCFYTRCHSILRVAGCNASELPEIFNLVQRNFITRQMEQRIEKHGAVACRENKTIAVRPLWIFWIVSQELCPEHISSIRHTHWHSRMSGICLL